MPETPLSPSRSPRWAPFALLLVSVAATFTLVEILLRLFLPYHPATIGHLTSRNGQRFGWGFGPHETLRIRHPDTGEVASGRTNNLGWRDRDRTPARRRGLLRILVTGDSNTFGVGVRDEETYTRVLEDALRADGLDAEVMNVAYGGFGTDQELEAVSELLPDYRPDLVIAQFCENDLADNLAFVRHVPPARPFGYRLEPDGTLTRLTDPAFGEALTAKERARALIGHSEVLKRGLGVWYVLRDRLETHTPLRVTPEARQRVAAELGLPDGAPLLAALAPLDGRTISEDELGRVLAGTSANHAAVVRAILTDLGQGVMPYVPPEPDLASQEWRTYARLLTELHDRVQAAGGALAVFSERDEGEYAFARRWYLVSGSAESHRRFLGLNDAVARVAAAAGASFVPHQQLVPRFQVDPHPDTAGHRAIAASLRAWLVREQAALLARKRAEAGR